MIKKIISILKTSSGPSNPIEFSSCVRHLFLKFIYLRFSRFSSHTNQEKLSSFAWDSLRFLTTYRHVIQANKKCLPCLPGPVRTFHYEIRINQRVCLNTELLASSFKIDRDSDKMGKERRIQTIKGGPIRIVELQP